MTTDDEHQLALEGSLRPAGTTSWWPAVTSLTHLGADRQMTPHTLDT